MKRKSSGKDWKRPTGVPAGNWEYINATSIANHYDQSLQESPLIAIDQQILVKHIPTDFSGTAVDFGCGTGRNIIPLLEKNWQVIGIDLSLPMLQQLARKLQTHHSASLVQANLMELDGLRDNIADFGQCMFSTFGMLQGKENRQKFLLHAQRILKPESTLLIHAHNYWHHLRIRGGITWMLSNLVAAKLGQTELGDRYADYRSVNQMMLHHFSLGGLKGEITAAGWHPKKTYAILQDGTFTDNIRAGRMGKAVGWVLACDNGK